jgi:hypothetical protein
MEYNNGQKEEKRYSLGEWSLRETLEKGKSIEIPSLNLSLNPNGSATSLDKKVL